MPSGHRFTLTARFTSRQFGSELRVGDTFLDNGELMVVVDELRGTFGNVFQCRAMTGGRRGKFHLLDIANIYDVYELDKS